MLAKNLRAELNEEQLRAVTHTGTPLLVLAGAGSGKTRVLVYRAAWMIDNEKVEANRIVLLTFTNKAAGEMKERISKLTDKRVGFAGTFHTFCAKLLRQYGWRVGVDPGFVIYDSGDSESAMKETIGNMGLDPKRCKPRALMSVISRMKNELQTVEEIETLAKDFLHKQTVDVWREYRRLMKKYEALDFDDLLVKAVELLRMRETGEIVRKTYGYILVDEYQDTNKAQFELTKLLTSSPDRLSVVGDASQAIYSFRGADFRNLSLLKEHFPELTEVRLEVNYRSTQNILDGAYGVINNNTNHPILRLTTNEGGGEKISLYEAMDEKDEAIYVVNRLAEEPETESAILYRTNAQSRAFEEELLRRGIGYKLVGGTRFYERAEIKDLIAYLRVIANDKDGVSWKRVEKLGKRKKIKFEEWLEKNKKLMVKMKAGEVLEEVLQVTDYKAGFDEKDEMDRGRLENVDEFRAVSGEHETLEAFLESVSLIQADEEAEQKKNESAKVTLMTVHAAKGLEFIRVFVVGMEEGLFPHSRSITEKDDMEEERRLLYVAITRAKKKLYVSLARNRLMYGGRQANMPSRFLAEIPERVVTRIGPMGIFHRNSRAGREKNIWKKEVEVVETRRIVQDWEVEKETAEDFKEIDNW